MFARTVARTIAKRSSGWFGLRRIAQSRLGFSLKTIRSRIWPSFATGRRYYSSIPQSTNAYLSGESPAYVQTLYRLWKSGNVASVPEAWIAYFSKLAYTPISSETQPPAGALDAKTRQDLVGIFLLERAYHVSGHQYASLDPLQQPKDLTRPAELLPATYGWSEADLDTRRFDAAALASISSLFEGVSGPLTLRQVIARLEETFCGTVAVEFAHIEDPAVVEFVRRAVERLPAESVSPADRRFYFEQLVAANQFEKFLHAKFNTIRRYGLDGAESLVPGLTAMFERATEHGAEQVVIGMPHRGRLNVIVNALGEPAEAVLQLFAGHHRHPGPHPPPLDGVAPYSDDVKYHMGCQNDVALRSGRTLHVSLLENPSHLEAVNPVAEGNVRSRQRRAGADVATAGGPVSAADMPATVAGGAYAPARTAATEAARRRIVPLLMHGDAAFSAQGIVYETIGMAGLAAFETGGTVHVVVNNQLGFTADGEQARSAPHCTEVAKTVGAPVFHVNADDVDAVVKVFRLAAEFRQRFLRDVVVDLVGYRRYGHNELDQPEFTQPLMYRTIAVHPNVVSVYAKTLGLTETDVQSTEAKAAAVFDAALARCVEFREFDSRFEKQWAGLGRRAPPRPTGVDLDILRSIAKVLYTPPPDFTAHKLLRLEDKRKAIISDGRVDWGSAEALAFGSLLLEGHHVRLTGQDVERGTFSHRHAVWSDQNSGKKFTALNSAGLRQLGGPKTAPFEVANSSLSELAVMGFEWGYALDDPSALVVWEAQFGDFANGAQILADQFLSASEAKWMRQNGLVLLLPHGYDGSGPEHSSARLERWLQLCDADPRRGLFTAAEDDGDPATGAPEQADYNMTVANLTTPANYFHALRRQIHRSFRKPLVVMSPKNLLRRVLSRIEDFGPGSRFHRVLGEEQLKSAGGNIDPADVSRVVFCTGQVYFKLLAQRDATKKTNVALVRLEQLYPFPFREVLEQLTVVFPSAKEVVWCQEEPRNMGAWTFLYPHFKTVFAEESKRRGSTAPQRELIYIGRRPAASPSTGKEAEHEKEQRAFLSEAFA